MAIKYGRPIGDSAWPRPVEAPAPNAPSLDLTTRMRRNRKSEWARRMVRENVLTADDLIWPLFVVAGKNVRVPVASMPGVERLSVDQAVREAVRAAELNIPCIALFPYTDPALRDESGSEALNPDNLVCQAIRAIKKEVPDIGILCDVALDPYTSHGHDGLMRGTEIVNDETVEVLVKQALVEAEAGCDIIAPSDMMDGRVGAIRAALDEAGYTDVQIMAYAAKYASAFYGPFRDAVGSSKTLTGDKRTYQMDPANSDEALARGRARHRGRRRHGDGEARPALSRHRPAREGCVRHADLRLSGVRRVFDDHGGGAERLARSRARHAGKPHGLQARRRGRGADLFRPDGGGETEKPHLGVLIDPAPIQLSRDRPLPYHPLSCVIGLSDDDVWGQGGGAAGQGRHEGAGVRLRDLRSSRVLLDHRLVHPLLCRTPAGDHLAGAGACVPGQQAGATACTCGLTGADGQHFATRSPQFRRPWPRRHRLPHPRSKPRPPSRQALRVRLPTVGRRWRRLPRPSPLRPLRRNPRQRQSAPAPTEPPADEIAESSVPAISGPAPLPRRKPLQTAAVRARTAEPPLPRPRPDGPAPQSVWTAEPTTDDRYQAGQ